jgi:hypothetical protein
MVLYLNSTMVNSAPLCFAPITRSISQSPNRVFSSTIGGRSSILTRFLIKPLSACLSLLREVYVFPLLRKYWKNSPPQRLSAHI